MKMYYGEETKKALKNFPFHTHNTRMEFILAMVKIKRAAAVANYKVGNFSLEVKDAIVKSCDEVLGGNYESQFPISSLQGGAGTAVHMNVNEIIANVATSFLGNKMKIHPNDHVNCSQSTNDVNPSALRIASLSLLEELNKSLSCLVNSFEDKSKEFKNINKLARTHLEDAVPTTLGAEFLAYAFNLKKHEGEIRLASELCKALNMGGTAIGNGINAKPIYVKEFYRELNNITNRRFAKVNNLMASTSSQTDFLIISQVVTSLCVELSKIASDFRLMASGPYGGIGEVILPELQKGSSIMPGKVNPVIPETVNQLYYIVSGNNLSIEKAVESAQLELGVMLPVIVDKLIESIKLTTEVINSFDELCVKKVIANEERCRENLENSLAYSISLVPHLGYDIVSNIVKKAILTKKKLREIVVEEKYLSESEFDKIIKSN